MIKVTNLKKNYGNFTAVDGISFSVKAGEILGFLGPNGAGKSTTMKILTSFIKPSSGSASVEGFDVVKDSLNSRSMIGYLPESSPSYKEMKVSEFLNFIATVRKLEKSKAKKAIDEVVEKTFLNGVYNQTIDTLSKGYKQRVGFAQALLHDPKVLILDEPTDGLDPNQKLIVRKLIKEISLKKTIILSTHILEEMEAVCTRVIIIDQGKIVSDSPTKELLAKSNNFNTIELTIDEQDKDIIDIIKKAKFVDAVEKNVFKDLQQIQLIISPKDNENIVSEIFNILLKSKVTPIGLEIQRAQADKVFRSLTKS